MVLIAFQLFLNFDLIEYLGYYYEKWTAYKFYIIIIKKYESENLCYWYKKCQQLNNLPRIKFQIQIM